MSHCWMAIPAAGSHSLQWNLRDAGNRPVPAGLLRRPLHGWRHHRHDLGFMVVR
ncbi:MAG: hypothetical protein M0C28_15670 [Candidatus Moduliflexus flocculans]|nr:hypothetical protein [Candidatus Moduliflexus flocculans]